MGNIVTEAWVIYEGKPDPRGNPPPAELRREQFTFGDVDETEVLAEPIFGCWEANMTHALLRMPVDICRLRGEERVVLGNAGVVRILRAGDAVQSLAEGDLCIVYCNGIPDESGYPEKILGYDAPNTMGVLAKRLKLKANQVIPIPRNTSLSLQQWAAFSLRYITAWANWQKAYGCWRLQFGDGEAVRPIVCGWGGGVSLAELLLAKSIGAETALISSDPVRLEHIRQLGVCPIDRRQFESLSYDDDKYQSDSAYRENYCAAEGRFLGIIKEVTRGEGVSIFLDYIGAPVYRATLKALAPRGVLTTAGWKMGMKTWDIRAIECMKWHTHVYTHYALYSQGVAAMQFAERGGWAPPLDGLEYSWEDIPALAADYGAGKISSYSPIFKINPL
ncbi:MAG TPA: zinc-binding alcohol dehydrogenase family protein [Blastocatellia bacterium]|nr:zinc-binding alcohol dehydrogenase family protein [Blastocatellia bacterium]